VQCLLWLCAEAPLAALQGPLVELGAVPVATRQQREEGPRSNPNYVENQNPVLFLFFLESSDYL